MRVVLSVFENSLEPVIAGLIAFILLTGAAVITNTQIGDKRQSKYVFPVILSLLVVAGWSEPILRLGSITVVVITIIAMTISGYYNK